MPARTNEDAARRIITNEYPVRGPLPRYVDDPVDPLDPSGAIRPRANARREYPANRLIDPRSAVDEWNRVVNSTGSSPPVIQDRNEPATPTPFGGSAIDPNNTPRVPEQIDTITQAGALLDYVESVESWGFDERDIVTRLLRFILKELERSLEQSAMDRRAATIDVEYMRAFNERMESMRLRIEEDVRRHLTNPPPTLFPPGQMPPAGSSRRRELVAGPEGYPRVRFDPEESPVLEQTTLRETPSLPVRNADGSWTEYNEADGIETTHHRDGRIVRRSYRTAAAWTGR